MGNPLEHFELHNIVNLSLFGLDISINQAVVMMWIVSVTVFLFFWSATRSGQLIPSKMQSVAEMGVEFIRDMVLENMGKEGMRLFPFIATLFFFILFSNLIGLIPGSYTVTSQIFVNIVMAYMVYLTSIVIGFKIHGTHYLSIFIPPGTPSLLKGPLALLEILTHIVIRPCTLAIRLGANMLAGHTVITVLVGMALMGGVLIGWMPLGFTVAIYVLEILVAFIQAYVFTILATVYIGEAIRLH